MVADSETPAAGLGPGALVISLDFELFWGIRDRSGGDASSRNRILGARAAVPLMLELFEEFEVAATWAIVGFLFAESRTELFELSPRHRPSYENPALSPYEERVGLDEEEDPLHYAGSLIERIKETPRQEIGTHTFSHYYCAEPGQDRHTFKADLEAARRAADRRGIGLKSIVFPRNQHNPEYDEILLELGITAFRGNPQSFGWRFQNEVESRSSAKRAARLIDSYVPLAGPGTIAWTDIMKPSGLADVCASYSLRGCSSALGFLDELRFRRIKLSLRHAASHNEVFHLWWHPHNFGVSTGRNIAFLRRVLTEFDGLRRSDGMMSLTMGEAGEQARTMAQHDSRTSRVSR